jgi:hypothetical protein
MIPSASATAGKSFPRKTKYISSSPGRCRRDCPCNRDLGSLHAATKLAAPYRSGGPAPVRRWLHLRDLRPRSKASGKTACMQTKQRPVLLANRQAARRRLRRALSKASESAAPLPASRSRGQTSSSAFARFPEPAPAKVKCCGCRLPPRSYSDSPARCRRPGLPLPAARSCSRTVRCRQISAHQPALHPETLRPPAASVASLPR